MLLLPSTNLDHLETTALRWTDIEAILAQSPARVVVFLDACHSGAAALGSGSQHEVAVGRLNAWHGPPMLILAASKGGQVALESEASGGGLFTSAISNTLTRDRPPFAFVKLNDFYAEVKRNVIDQSNGRQIAWFGRRGLFADFVMF